jgi:hypothetical protein
MHTLANHKPEKGFEGGYLAVDGPWLQPPLHQGDQPRTEVQGSWKFPLSKPPIHFQVIIHLVQIQSISRKGMGRNPFLKAQITLKVAVIHNYRKFKKIDESP